MTPVSPGRPGRRDTSAAATKKAAGPSRALEALVEAFEEPALVVSRSGTVRAANPAGRELVRGAPSSVAGALVGNHDGFEMHRLHDSELRLLLRRGERGAIELVAEHAQAEWRLTTRETEVLRHLLRGLGNKELACVLGCTKRTVETHVTSVLVKSGMSSRLELVANCWMRWAERNGHRG